MIRALLLSSLFFSTIACIEIQTERSELVFKGKTSRSIAAESVYPVSMQVAPRGYIVDVFRDVFEIQEDSTLDKMLITNIYKKVEFGGGCDVYEASNLDAYNQIEFPNESCGSINSTQVATSNPMRFSITSKVCEDILSDSVARESIRKKIFPSTSQWGNPSDMAAIKRMWNLFYPIDKINAATSKALEVVGYSTNNEEEAWKAMIFTVCSSPAWQVL